MVAMSDDAVTREARMLFQELIDLVGFERAKELINQAVAVYQSARSEDRASEQEGR